MIKYNDIFIVCVKIGKIVTYVHLHNVSNTWWCIINLEIFCWVCISNFWPLLHMTKVQRQRGHSHFTGFFMNDLTTLRMVFCYKIWRFNRKSKRVILCQKETSGTWKFFLQNFRLSWLYFSWHQKEI